MGNAESFLSHINCGADPSMTAPLNLAYLGDCVFELMIRSKIVAENKAGVSLLHKYSSGYARAAAQSEMYFRVEGFLNDEEATVIKRGRNAKIKTKAKNASITEYRHATGLEALFGYLYLKGRYERITELFQICINYEESCFGEKKDS